MQVLWRLESEIRTQLYKLKEKKTRLLRYGIVTFFFSFVGGMIMTPTY